MSEEELLQLVCAKEDEIRAHRFESAFFWGWQRTLLLRKEGELTTVKFADEEQVLLRGAISTHHHPLGWSVANVIQGAQGIHFRKTMCAQLAISRFSFYAS